MKKQNMINAACALSAGLFLTACSSTHHDRSMSSTSGYQSGYASESVYEGSGAQTSQSYSSAQTSQDRNDVVIPLHEERLNVGKRTVDSGQVTIRKIVTTETVNQPIQLRRESLVIDREGGQGSSSYSSSQSGNRNDSGWKQGANSEQNYNSSSSERTERTELGSPRATEQQGQSTLNEPSGAAVQSQPHSEATNHDKENQANSSVNEPAGAANQRSSTYSSSQSDSTQQGQSGTAFQEQTFTIRLQEEQPVIEKNVVQTGRVVARKDSQMQQQNISQQVRREDVQVDKSGAGRNVEIRGNYNASGTLNEPSGAQRPMKENQSSEDSRQESIQRDSTESQQSDYNQNESSESSTRNRAPTQGQGARDLQQKPDSSQP